MPELPEVETVMRGIEPVLTGRMLDAVTVHRYDLRGGVPTDFIARTQGAHIRRLARRGKYILMHLDNAHSIVMHLGMSGRVRLYDDAHDYISEPHDHVFLDTDAGARLVLQDPRRFGMLYLAGHDDWQAQAPFSAMGPEPLGNGFSGPALHRALAGRKSPIKTALLDQRVVAGLGNIYVCEALYRAHISPLRPACSLSEAQAGALHEAIVHVLRDAIAAGGSSLRDYKKADGGLGYFQHHFRVYGQTGTPCPSESCGGTIEHCVQGGRSTFYCRQCQL